MKIVYCSTDLNGNDSFVTIEHRGKLYSGKARCAEEDHFSQFTGCRYAEIRAKIKAYKNDYKEKKAECEACRKFVNSVKQYKNFDPNSKEAKLMFKQLSIRIREVNEIADKINSLMLSLRAMINQQTRLNQNRLIKNEEK